MSPQTLPAVTLNELLATRRRRLLVWAQRDAEVGCHERVSAMRPVRRKDTGMERRESHVDETTLDRPQTPETPTSAETRMTLRVGTFPHNCSGYQCRVCWWVWHRRMRSEFDGLKK